MKIHNFGQFFTTKNTFSTTCNQQNFNSKAYSCRGGQHIHFDSFAIYVGGLVEEKIDFKNYFSSKNGNFRPVLTPGVTLGTVTQKWD